MQYMITKKTDAFQFVTIVRRRNKISAYPILNIL